MREAYIEFLQFEETLKKERFKKEVKTKKKIEKYQPFCIDTDTDERVKNSLFDFMANQLSLSFKQMHTIDKE